MKHLACLLIGAILVGCSGTDANAPDPRVTDASRPLVLLTHPNNPPFSLRDASGNYVGTDIDRARKIAS